MGGAEVSLFKARGIEVMSTVGQREILTQKRVIAFFKDALATPISYALYIYRFAPLGGVELYIPPREPMRDVPQFGSVELLGMILLDLDSEQALT